MKVYLARHGEYLQNDTQGALSDTGKNEIKLLAEFLKESHIQVASIFHSGKLRAKQTAELLSAGFVTMQPTQSKAGLNPGDDINLLIDELNATDEDILLVGHLPFMGKLVGKLVTDNENEEIVIFHPGTMVCLERVMGQNWVIHWVINPTLLTAKRI